MLKHINLKSDGKKLKVNPLPKAPKNSPKPVNVEVFPTYTNKGNNNCPDCNNN